MSIPNSTYNIFRWWCSDASQGRSPSTGFVLRFVLLVRAAAFAEWPGCESRRPRRDVSHLIANGYRRSSNGGGSDSQRPPHRVTGAMIIILTGPVAAPLAGHFASPPQNFDGQSAQDNRNLFGFAFVPPEPMAAVGATQFVQMVNVTSGVDNRLELAAARPRSHALDRFRRPLRIRWRHADVRGWR